MPEDDENEPEEKVYMRDLLRKGEIVDVFDLHITNTSTILSQKEKKNKDDSYIKSFYTTYSDRLLCLVNMDSCKHNQHKYKVATHLVVL